MSIRTNEESFKLAEAEARRAAIREVAVKIMADLFCLVEENGGCFDVLVREAIERGERRPHDDDA